MTWVEILIIIATVSIVVSVIATCLVRKLKGKPSLTSDCCGCPYAKDCKHAGNCLEHDGKHSDGHAIKPDGTTLPTA